MVLPSGQLFRIFDIIKDQMNAELFGIIIYTMFGSIVQFNYISLIEGNS